LHLGAPVVRRSVRRNYDSRERNVKGCLGAAEEWVKGGVPDGDNAMPLTRYQDWGDPPLKFPVGSSGGLDITR